MDMVNNAKMGALRKFVGNCRYWKASQAGSILEKEE